jgi:serine/threonine protein kinase
LGKGTFGKVKKGVHLITKEIVAIKIIDKKSIIDADDQVRIKR